MPGNLDFCRAVTLVIRPEAKPQFTDVHEQEVVLQRAAVGLPNRHISIDPSADIAMLRQV